ncbi:nucleoside deaminase [Glaciihabitans sp. INWT7]|uniref:nucleoside deaminase n=1 Tax=Glaciihabitans sp. INWT7 TaxID=2596912 RepID=UPI0016275E76|nr:nucleoside deaminase [Glaciihabitans sp. INWT7]QNE48104.1 nucleoside deaminase [Glaciihabitans sp. INWT7]
MDASPTDLDHLARAVQLARDARARGDHPFGAVLVTRDGTVVEAMNSVTTTNDPTGHAETNLVRSSAALGAGVLASSTLYTSTEPCAMCAGAIYWAGVGRMVYALSGSALVELVAEASGSPRAESRSLDLPSREVFARGTGSIEVLGPVEIDGAVEVHDGMWG